MFNWLVSTPFEEFEITGNNREEVKDKLAGMGCVNWVTIFKLSPVK